VNCPGFTDIRPSEPAKTTLFRVVVRSGNRLAAKLLTKCARVHQISKAPKICSSTLPACAAIMCTFGRSTAWPYRCVSTTITRRTISPKKVASAVGGSDGLAPPRPLNLQQCHRRSRKADDGSPSLGPHHASMRPSLAATLERMRGVGLKNFYGISITFGSSDLFPIESMIRCQ